MIKFATPVFLYFLAAVPALTALFAWSHARRRRSLKIFGDYELVSRLTESARPRLLTARAALFTIAVTLISIAAARPQLGTKMETVKREGIDVVIAMDVSASMNAEDALGSSRGPRIEKAKHEIAAMLDILQEDRVGLVAFSGIAHVQCPLTLDYDAAKIFLEVFNTDLIPVPGTAIGDAVKTSMKMFDPNEKKYKAIILITDGEDHDSDPVGAAKEAEKQGIRIYTIGIGSPQGTPIPIFDEKGGKAGFKKDSKGNLVLSSLDEKTLEEMALLTGGKYYPATLGEFELKKIFNDITHMEKKQLATRKYSHFEDRFQWPLGLALILLAIEAFIPSGGRTRKRRLANEPVSET